MNVIRKKIFTSSYLSCFTHIEFSELDTGIKLLPLTFLMLIFTFGEQQKSACGTWMNKTSFYISLIFSLWLIKLTQKLSKIIKLMSKISDFIVWCGKITYCHAPCHIIRHKSLEHLSGCKQCDYANAQFEKWYFSIEYKLLWIR